MKILCYFKIFLITQQRFDSNTVKVILLLCLARTADNDTAFNGTYHFRSHNLSAESGQVKLHTYSALLLFSFSERKNTILKTNTNQYSLHTKNIHSCIEQKLCLLHTYFKRW